MSHYLNHLLTTHSLVNVFGVRESGSPVMYQFLLLFSDLRKRNLEDDDLQFALQSNFLGDTDYDRDRVSDIVT